MNLGNFPADSETGTPCTDIKIFELNFQINSLLNFEHFYISFILLMQMSYAKLEITKRKHQEQSMERFGIASHHDIQKIMDKWKNKNTAKGTATWMNVIPNL